MIAGACTPSVRLDLAASTPPAASLIKLNDDGDALQITVRGQWAGIDKVVRRTITGCLVAATGLRANASARDSAGVLGPLGVRSVIDQRQSFEPPPDAAYANDAGPDDTLHYDLRTLRGDEGWLRIERLTTQPDDLGRDRLRLIAHIGVLGSSTRESCILTSLANAIQTPKISP